MCSGGGGFNPILPIDPIFNPPPGTPGGDDGGGGTIPILPPWMPSPLPPQLTPPDGYPTPELPVMPIGGGRTGGGGSAGTSDDETALAPLDPLGGLSSGRRTLQPKRGIGKNILTSGAGVSDQAKTKRGRTLLG